MNVSVQIDNLEQWNNVLKIFFDEGYSWWTSRDTEYHQEYLTGMSAGYLEVDEKGIRWDEEEYTSDYTLISYFDFMSRYEEHKYDDDATKEYILSGVYGGKIVYMILDGGMPDFTSIRDSAFKTYDYNEAKSWQTPAFQVEEL